MSERDGRRPCIIGVAPRTVRPDEGLAPEPLELWEGVCRAAVADASARRDLLSAVESLRVVFCESWQYDRPAERLAQRLGISPAECSDTGRGGVTPEVMVERAGEMILRGELDVAMVCGAEAMATFEAYQRAGETPPWTHREPRPYTSTVPVERAVGLEAHGAPFRCTLIDNQRRARLPVDRTAYVREMGELLSGMTEVAAGNPYAWFRRAQDAEALITVGPKNRQVTDLYAKQMVAMWAVDMAGAIIVASDEAADRLGVPDDRRVYLHGWCAANDATQFAPRPTISLSPAMVAASQEALRCAGLGMDDVRHLDIYSCFTGALNLARDALGVQDRPGDQLTVTGGLPYNGGPGSNYNYMLHSIATLTHLLREEPDEFGMVTGTGMSFNKQAFGIYSARPPENPVPPNDAAIQKTVDDLPYHEVDETYAGGTASVSTFAVQFDRSGSPMTGVAILDVAEGVRAYARMDAADVLAYAVERDLIGKVVDVEQGHEGPGHQERALTTGVFNGYEIEPLDFRPLSSHE